MGVDEAALAFLLGIAIPLGIQWADRRYLMHPDERARSWNYASWGSALLAFGPLSLVGWIWVTRRGRKRWGALLALALLLAALSMVGN